MADCDESTPDERISEIETDTESARIEHLEEEVLGIQAHQSDIEASIESLASHISEEEKDIPRVESVEQLYEELDRLNEEMAEIKQHVQDLTEEAITG